MKLSLSLEALRAKSDQVFSPDSKYSFRKVNERSWTLSKNRKPRIYVDSIFEITSKIVDFSQNFDFDLVNNL